jgi:hypothetical protein
MIQELQDHEIGKTAIGKSNTQTLNTSVAPLTLVGTRTTIVNFDSLLSPGQLSASKMLPFEEFYNILQQNENRERHALTSSENQRRTNKNPKHSNSSNKPILAESNDLLSTSEEMPTAVETNFDKITSTQPARIDLTSQLQSRDELFNSYLKVSEGEQLSTKLLAKLSSNLSKPKKPRRLVPLGKDAICLTDSRGRQTKHASKGFQNLFKVSENLGDMLPKVEDDIIARLNNREQCEMKFVDNLGIQNDSNDESELGNKTASAKPQRKSRGTARAKQGSSKSDSDYKNFYGEDIGKFIGKFSLFTLWNNHNKPISLRRYSYFIW